MAVKAGEVECLEFWPHKRAEDLELLGDISVHSCLDSLRGLEFWKTKSFRNDFRMLEKAAGETEVFESLASSKRHERVVRFCVNIVVIQLEICHEARPLVNRRKNCSGSIKSKWVAKRAV